MLCQSRTHATHTGLLVAAFSTHNRLGGGHLPVVDGTRCRACRLIVAAAFCPLSAPFVKQQILEKWDQYMQDCCCKPVAQPPHLQRLSERLSDSGIAVHVAVVDPDRVQNSITPHSCCSSAMPHGPCPEVS